MTEMIYIPFSKEFYEDLIRLSDGKFDVPAWAENRIRAWVDLNLNVDMQESFYEAFGDRIEELAEKYAPESMILRRWAEEDSAALKRRPLVWKEVTIPEGSEVRMSYGGKQHYARVENEAITDGGEQYSPNEWTLKVTGTARNAWRDLWFKKPGVGTVWESAVMLRQKAKAILKAEGAQS